MYFVLLLCETKKIDRFEKQLNNLRVNLIFSFFCLSHIRRYIFATFTWDLRRNYVLFVDHLGDTVTNLHNKPISFIRNIFVSFAVHIDTHRK